MCGASDINIENALRIPGWMNQSELSWLAERARESQKVVEVGSWRGRSTRALADNTPGVVYAVDTWKGSVNGVCQQEIGKHAPGWLKREFQKNMDGLLGNKVQVMEMDSLKAAERLSGQDLDLVFIDAEHTYESVRSDILAWYGLVRNGGILAGHDYGGSWEGVQRAVDEMIPDHERVPGTYIWWKRIHA